MFLILLINKIKNIEKERDEGVKKESFSSLSSQLLSLSLTNQEQLGI
jgi:hypothetical protein